MWKALRRHWPEYLIEGAGLGLFMISACLVGIVLLHPASPVPGLVPDPTVRRVIFGIAMGLTAIGIIYSPWGKQSGAHLNPSVTLTFFRLGKVAGWDAFFYVLAQFLGGALGVVLMVYLSRGFVAHMQVNYVVTTPGPQGSWAAFAAEVLISFLLMSMVLLVTNTARIAHLTGLFAGAMVATYIAVEAPISGMSMNPARTFASAFSAHLWDSLWLYFTAPPLGMLLAAEVYVRTRGARRVFCAKLHHQNKKRCIFCEYHGGRPV
jgi:aquaporin Z